MDLLDTWNMRITPIAEHVSGTVTLELPSTSHMALRFRRKEQA